jgi:hypothetical protein
VILKVMVVAPTLTVNVAPSGRPLKVPLIGELARDGVDGGLASVSMSTDCINQIDNRTHQRLPAEGRMAA